MNDFERKLSQQTFRAPPPDLRAAILGTPANVIVPDRWIWRDWLWPSPRAWAALAALWVIFAALSFSTGETASPESAVAQQPAEGVTLLTFHQPPPLPHVLALPN